MASVSCGNTRNILRFDAAGFHRFIVAAFPVAQAANLAAVTGQSLSAAEKQTRGETKPSAEAIGALIAAFGVPFIVAVFPASKGHLAPFEGAAKARAALNQIAELAAMHGG